MTQEIPSGINNQAGDKPVSLKVEAAIKNGQVRMLPKWRFILKTALAVSGVLFFALALLYLVSLIIFISRPGGFRFAPALGLPWLLLLLAFIFVIILEILANHYPMAYSQPLLYSLLIIIIIAIIGGLFLERLELHNRLAGFAERKRLPIVNSFYHNVEREREARHRNEINFLTGCSN